MAFPKTAQLRWAATAFVCLLLAVTTHAAAQATPTLHRISADSAVVVPEFAREISPDLLDYDFLHDQAEVTIAGIPLETGESVTLELSRFEIFTADARVVIGTPDGDVDAGRPTVALFRGVVAERPDSLVFLGVSPYGVHGYLRLPDGLRIITSGPYTDGLPTVLYNMATLPPGAINWQPFVCAADQMEAVSDVDLGSLGSDFGLRDNACRQIDVAVETDYEFTSTLFGGDTNASAAYAATLLGAIEEIYRRDVDTSLGISYLRLWSTSGDPWTRSDLGQQLSQFRTYWNSNMVSVNRTIAHMLSGRNLGGGVAWVGVLCGSSYGYSLATGIGGSFPYPLVDHSNGNGDVIVSAHEMGHNCNAPHTHDMTPKIDGCGDGDCSAPLSTIMSYCHLCAGGLANIALNFHSRIINERMLPHISSSASCLSPAESTIVQQPADAAVVDSQSVSFSVAVDSAATTAPTYQWYRNGSPLSNNANVIGSATDTLTIVSPQLGADDGTYHVVVTDACTTLASDTAQLIIAIHGDTNCDGAIDLFDIDAFVLALTNSTTYYTNNPGCNIYTADMNGDGAINNFDIDPFVAALTGR